MSSVSEIVTITKAIADPARVDILRQLCTERCPKTCSELSAESELAQSSMSHHFTKLVRAKVVREQKNGKEKVYELNTAYLEGIGIDIVKMLCDCKEE